MRAKTVVKVLMTVASVPAKRKKRVKRVARIDSSPDHEVDTVVKTQDSR